MPGRVVEPDKETVAVQHTITEGAPDPFRSRARRPRMSPLEIEAEPSAEVRAAERRAARRVFRLYCVACGRSSEAATAPARAGRCPTCGGTMLLELAGD
jgi:hypothetical protein